MIKNLFRLFLALGFFSIFVPSNLAAQNLVLNPNFDSGIAVSWSGTATLDSTNGYPTTPSARLTSLGSLQTLTSSCITYTAASVPLDLGFFRKDNTGDPIANFSGFFNFFSDGVCSVPATNPTLVSLGSPAPGWLQSGVVNFTPSTSSGSFRVQVNVSYGLGKPAPLAAIGADFDVDHVYAGPAGTTPVALQSFRAD